MAFETGSTYRQYVPDMAAERITLTRTNTWPNATAVLTNPAAEQVARMAAERQATLRRSGPYDGLFPAVLTITGPAAVIAEIAAYIRTESRTPATRVAYHRALDATWRDATTQRKFRKNFKAALAQ